MLDCQEYEVPFDSSNDYYRRYKLEERIHLLRTEQEKQVESAKKEFSRWLEASKSDIDVLEGGLANGKYHIRYDSDNDDARRSQLEAELRPLLEKRKKECAEILNNLKKLTFNTACKLAISQSIICLRGFQCRESFAKATSQPPCVGYDADENAKQYAEAQRNF